MKKILKTTLIILLVCILAVTVFCGGFALYILNCSSAIGSRLIVDEDNKTLSVNDDKDLRILQLSDTQITAYGDALKTLDIIKLTVDKAKPDLIVLTGDNLMNDSKQSMLKKYIRFMDKFEIPWAPVFGNHDYNVDATMDRQCELYESSKYCIFKKGTVQNSYGNYYYNIERNGTPVYTLFFMDNGISFTDAHLDWYANSINAIAEENGAKLPSWVFFHIPLVETYYAYYHNLYNGGTIDGEMRDGGVTYLRDDAGFFDVVKELGSTTALIFGHNHRNNFICDYQGIKFCYGLKTGRASYHDVDMLGGNLFLLKADNTFTVERIFVEPMQNLY